MKTTILALDVGTTNWKAVLFSETGELLRSQGAPAVLREDRAGQNYDAEELWASFAGTIRGLVEGIGAPAAVCVTSMAEAGFPVNERGEPIYPAITWFDPRSLPQAKRIERDFGVQRIFEITGQEPNPIYSLTKILWLRENEPAVYSRMRKWLPMADFVNFRLCGEMATDFSLASRTLAFDLDAKKWSEEILSAVGVPAGLFPEVRASGTRLGGVTRRAASETGLAEGTHVFLGGHDHHCAFLSAGALIDEVVLDSSGTAESIMTLLAPGLRRPKGYKGMRVSAFIDPARYATMGGILASGASVDWAIENVWAKSGVNGERSQEVYSEVITAVEAAPVGSKGLFFLPHLRGAGAPLWEPRARGAFVGLRTIHTRQDLLRAVFEGLCFELKALLEAVKDSFDIEAKGLNTVGGGAKNRVWQQIKADVTGVPVNVPDVKEATAQGAALIAGVGLGLYANLAEASRHTFRLLDRYEPRPERTEAYAELYPLYKEIFPGLRDVNVALGERDAKPKG